MCKRFVFIFVDCWSVSVDLRYTKLSSEEIEKISQKVATDWNELGGLFEIPFKQRDEITVNHNSYPNSSAKAKKILKIFNERTDFDRHLLKKYLGEINLDLDEILAPTNQVFIQHFGTHFHHLFCRAVHHCGICRQKTNNVTRLT